jgi:hypothetical protein
MSVVHIPGPVIAVGRRKIQRCAVCGEKLVDNKAFIEGRVMAWSRENLEGGTPGFWPTLEPIRVDGTLSYVIEHVDGEQLPDDSCITLVEGD